MKGEKETIVEPQLLHNSEGGTESEGEKETLDEPQLL